MNRIVFLLVFVLLIIKAFGQDPSFTQFGAAPIYFNPAFAGSVKEKRISVLYRNQWPKIEGNYQTVTASYDQFVKYLRGGLGFVSMYDQAGGATIKTSTNSLVYAPKFKIKNKVSISAGIKASYIYKSIDVSQLTFGDMIDEQYGFIYTTQENIKPNVSFFDFSSGILVNTNKFFANIAIDHLLQPNQSFLVDGNSPLNRKFVFSTAYTFQKTDSADFSISPGLQYETQGSSSELKMNAGIRYKFIIAGLSYDMADSFAGLLGVQIAGIRLVYSYDYLVSDLQGTGGVHEVSLRGLIK